MHLLQKVLLRMFLLHGNLMQKALLLFDRMRGSVTRGAGENKMLQALCSHTNLAAGRHLNKNFVRSIPPSIPPI
jgi:hypothetical protein